MTAGCVGAMLIFVIVIVCIRVRDEKKITQEVFEERERGIVPTWGTRV